MEKNKNLPIGYSSFEAIREEGFVYVDKTRHIYQLASQGKYYFLSRPCRFGKSLTVSTLMSLFQGKKALFERLWIAGRKDWSWKPHPVILLDFNEISHDTPKELELSLAENLKYLAEKFDIRLNFSLLKGQFKELILALHEKTGTKVVVLIDEYDKPLIDHLGRGREGLEIAKSNRDLLSSFLGVLKGGQVSSALRFVFITGISKFSRVSLFSELNNLEDLSMAQDQADMLGYTQQELEENFAPHIRQFAQAAKLTEKQTIEALRKQYNGYRFSIRDIQVYNPFSILCALKQKELKNYWFETGTPAFLVNIFIEFDDTLFIIEFKCDQAADKAIEQIREKGYDRMFKGEGKKIVLMGIDFDSKKKNVSQWKVV